VYYCGARLVLFYVTHPMLCVAVRQAPQHQAPQFQEEGGRHQEAPFPPPQGQEGVEW
jgi:hypothetical protein